MSEWINPPKSSWTKAPGTPRSTTALLYNLVVSRGFLCPGSGPQQVSQTEQQFRDFLLRTERYALASTYELGCTQRICNVFVLVSYLPIVGVAKRRLILLEDLPFLQKAKEVLTKLLQDHLKYVCVPFWQLSSQADSTCKDWRISDCINTQRRLSGLLVAAHATGTRAPGR